MIVSLRLTEDARYLVSLLTEVAEQDRPIVAAALKRLTGQKVGLDVAAWKKWLSAQPRKSPAP